MNISDIELSNKKTTNVRLIDINQWPETGDHLTPNLYVSNVFRNSLNLLSLLRLDPDEKLNLDKQASIPLILLQHHQRHY